MDSPYLDPEQETMPWPQQRARLEERLREFLPRVAASSPAWARLWSRAGVDLGEVRGLDDLPRLPVLRLEALRREQERRPPLGGWETAPLTEMGRIYVNPGFIFQPGPRQYQDRSWAQALRGAGVGPGDRVLNTFNYHLWPFALMMDASARGLGAQVVPGGVGNTMVQVRVMQKLGITAFVGTPSFLMTLAQRAEGMGLKLPGDLALAKALVGAEMLPQSLRSRLEDKLGIPIRQCYGTVLLGCLGYECAHESGLHVPFEVVVEVVDPQSGQPVEPGKVGEVVASNFDPVYPMLRLATGDLSRLVENRCACGRGGLMLERVLGRIDEAAKVRGTFVHPWQTDQIMARYGQVFKYQLVITRPGDQDQMVCRVELAEESAEPARLARDLERDLEEMLGVRGRVEVAPRGSIPDFHATIEDKRSWD